MTMIQAMRSEYLLWGGDTGLSVAAHTSSVVVTAGRSSLGIFLVAEQNGTWALQAVVAGNYVTVGAGNYTAQTPTLIAMEDQLPYAVRLVVTPAVAGHLLASAVLDPAKDEQYDDALPATSSWIALVTTTLDYQAVGPTGSVVTANRGSGWATQGAAGVLTEASTLMGVHDPVQGLLADAADKTGIGSSHAAKLRGLVQLAADLNTILGVTTGAAVTSDAAATLQQYLRGLAKLSDSVWDESNNHLDIAIDGSNQEVLLCGQQLLSGAAGGVLQAILAYVKTQPALDNTFIITNGITTETYIFKAAHGADFEVARGVSAAESQTNLVAEINARSALWSAVETTNLGRFFTATPTKQFVVYRKAIASANIADRVYGTQTAVDGIQVGAFSQVGYSSASVTVSNIPAADPATKTFGFMRALSVLSSSSRHRCAEDSLTYAWNRNTQAWRFAWDLADLGMAEWPYPGTSVVLAVSGVSAELAADLPPGRYELICTCDVWWAITASGGGGAAVWGASPGRPRSAMHPYRFMLRSPKRIACITTGGSTGSFVVDPVSTAPVM